METKFYKVFDLAEICFEMRVGIRNSVCNFVINKFNATFKVQNKENRGSQNALF